MIHGFGGTWSIFNSIFMLAFWIKYLVTQSLDSQKSSREAPLDILKKKYAKGKITKEEFERIKRELSD